VNFVGGQTTSEIFAGSDVRSEFTLATREGFGHVAELKRQSIPDFAFRVTRSVSHLDLSVIIFYANHSRTDHQDG
jgi:hypothetical protein